MSGLIDRRNCNVLHILYCKVTCCVITYSEILYHHIFINFNLPSFSIQPRNRNPSAIVSRLTLKGFNRCAIRLYTLVNVLFKSAWKLYFVSGFTQRYDLVSWTPEWRANQHNSHCSALINGLKVISARKLLYSFRSSNFYTFWDLVLFCFNGNSR